MYDENEQQIRRSQDGRAEPAYLIREAYSVRQATAANKDLVLLRTSSPFGLPGYANEHSEQRQERSLAWWSLVDGVDK